MPAITKPRLRIMAVARPLGTSAILQAIDRIGSAELARRLGCSKQLVSFWRTGRQRVKAERAVEIELVTEGQIRREELRPDIFTPPQEAA